MLPECGEWDAQQDPPFSRVLDVLRKSLCTIVAVMAEAVEGWCCFFPLASQGLSLCDGSWKRRGSEWSAVDTREPADIPKLYLSHHTTVLSLEAAPTQLCPLCLIMSPNCLHMNYNMRRLEVLDNALPGFDLQKTSSSVSVGHFCTFLSLLCMLGAYGISLCFCCG